MADDADRTEERAELALLTALHGSRKDEPEAFATGFCLFCEALLHEAGRRWCDADCRDDWQMEQL